MGGYFIINGNERLIRFLIVPRRNHVTSIIRNSFQNRGAAYTPYGVQVRSVRPDQTSQTNTLHYLSNGGSTLRFSWRKSEYMVPVVMILKALTGATNKEIFLGILQKDFDNTFVTDRVELLLRGFKTYGLYTRAQCLEFLGDKFRVVLGCPEDWSNERVGMHMVETIVLPHLKDPRDKLRLLLYVPSFVSSRLLELTLVSLFVTALCFASCTPSSVANAVPTTPTRLSTRRSSCPASSTASS